MAGWLYRAKGFDWNVDEMYYPNTPLFSIKIHHGGEFEYTPQRKYVGGTSDYFDYCHGDFMSISEINKMIKFLGYADGIIYYHYKLPHLDLDNGLKVLEGDIDILKVIELGRTHKCIEVYIELGHTSCEQYFNTQGLNSSVVIEELNETEVGEISLKVLQNPKVKQGEMTQLLMNFTDDEIERVGLGFESRTQAGIDTDSQSDHLNGFSFGNDEIYDPDYNIEDVCAYGVDDLEFEQYVDSDVEWGGLNHKENGNTDQRNSYSVIGDIHIDDKGSNYASSNDLRSVRDSDDEDTCDSLRRRGLDFHSQTSMTNPEYTVGLRFANAKEVKQSLKQYAIKNRRVIHLAKNDKTRIRAECRGGDKCPWVILVSPKQNECTWEVKTFVDVHTCTPTRKNIYMTSAWLANTYIESFRADPTWSLEGIILLVRQQHKLEITRNQAKRAKRLAYELNHGNHAQQYGLLWDYCQEVRRTNPNTTMKIMFRPEINVNAPDERKFLRVYCCLGPLKAGFAAGCRKVIGMDGCFLKGPFTGQILTAIAMDANNGMYPLAYAVVEAENRESWQWFLELLINDIGFNPSEHWVVISDKQKGLDLALSELLPYVEHRFCLLHMYNNYKKQFRGKEYKDKLYKVAFATNMPQFKAAMEALKQKDAEAFEWACKRNPPQWSKSHFSESVKCDALMNNISESFNAHIVSARDKPVITLLEMIRNYLMKRIPRKLVEIEKCETELLPKIQKNINISKVKALDFIADWNGGTKYQLRGPWGAQFVVDLSEGSCTCRKWQLSGVPCAHAIAAIWCEGQNGGNGKPESWVHDCYSKETQRRIYEHTINPINGVEMWEHVEGFNKIVAPSNQTQPGRPPKARKKDVDEINKDTADPTRGSRKGRVMTCMRCGGTRHNSRNCKGQGCQAPERGRKQDEGTSNRGSARGRGKGKTVNVVSQGAHGVTNIKKDGGTGTYSQIGSNHGVQTSEAQGRGCGASEHSRVIRARRGISISQSVHRSGSTNSSRKNTQNSQPVPSHCIPPKFSFKGKNCIVNGDLEAQLAAKKRKMAEM